MADKIRILIVDDHAEFRQGLRAMLNSVPELELVGEAEDGAQTVQLALTLQPDIILMDLQMPKLNGVDATRQIVYASPHIGVIMLTMYDDDDSVFAAMRAGARGYLLKDVDAEALLEAIRQVAHGEALIDPLVATKVLSEFRRLSDPTAAHPPLEQLTEGEMNVLRYVAQGLDNREIAEQLSLSESTIANRLRDIYQKLYVNNRTQAALYALRRGWATLDAG
jgi:DNA-binding NarL/FixJ family response regulator